MGAAKHVFWAGPGSCSRGLMVADPFIKVSKHSSASPLAEEILVAVWGRMIVFCFFFEGLSIVNDSVAGPIPVCTWPILTGLSRLKGCAGGMK